MIIEIVLAQEWADGTAYRRLHALARKRRLAPRTPPYERILKAAERGTGVTLSADECAEIVATTAKGKLYGA